MLYFNYAYRTPLREFYEDVKYETQMMVAKCPMLEQEVNMAHTSFVVDISSTDATHTGHEITCQANH